MGSGLLLALLGVAAALPCFLGKPGRNQLIMTVLGFAALAVGRLI